MGAPLALCTDTFPWCAGQTKVEADSDCALIKGRTTNKDNTCANGKWDSYSCSSATYDDEVTPIGFICEVNPENEHDWEKEWDEDEDEEGEEEKEETGGGGGGGGNGTAVFFAVVGWLGCAASIAYNYVQHKRANGGGGSSTRGIPTVNSMPVEIGAATGYRAPTQIP